MEEGEEDLHLASRLGVGVVERMMIGWEERK